MENQEIRDYLYNFYKENEIPHNVPRDYNVNDWYDKGVIRGEDLKHGKYYIGKCRNAVIGRWDANKQVMWHMRYKFGFYADNVNYLDNDNGFDLFVAIKEIDVNEVPEDAIVDIEEFN
jgi:hypothetical protein